jgi:hypothetical protein
VRGRIPEPISEVRAVEVRAIVDALQWRAATSEQYRDIPHEYTVRRPAVETAYVALYEAIRRHGITERFERHGKVAYYRYLHLDGWKYWWMGALPVSRILNRARA